MPAGDSLNTATNLNLNANLQTFADSIDTVHPNDYYKFTFNSRSSFNLTLNGLSADADVELLNSSGEALLASINTGSTAESINSTLDSGTYYIRVHQGVSTAITNYNLNLQARGSDVNIVLRDFSSGLNYIWGTGGSDGTSIVAGGSITDGNGNPLALPSSFSIVGTADFNQDGIPDILLRDSNSGLNYIWGMGGNGTTVVGGGPITDGNGNPLALPNTISMLGIADFNQDGIPDILLRDSNSGVNYIWGMGGNGTTVVGGGPITDGNGNQLALPSSFSIIGTADFNQDGIPDILLRDSNSGVNYIWGMGGNGTIVMGGGPITDGNGNPLALPSSFLIIGTADFNQDGIPDILLRDSNSGLNYIWGMGGNGTSVVGGGPITDGNGNPLALPSSFSIIGTADFNQDGIPDILLRNSNSGLNYIWGMGGNGTIVMGGGPITDGNGNQLALSNSFSLVDTSSSNRIQSIDIAGNTIGTSFSIGALNGGGIFEDLVSSTDADDYYSFSLETDGEFNLFLDSLSGDANVELIDSSSGSVIQVSDNAGTTAESISVSLVAGDYYIRVYANSNDADYRLSVSRGGIGVEYYNPRTSGSSNFPFPILDPWLDNDPNTPADVLSSLSTNIVGSNKALILDPFRWQFEPNDEADNIAAALTAAGFIVDSKANNDKNTPTISIEDFKHLDQYGVIVIVSHGGRADLSVLKPSPIYNDPNFLNPDKAKGEVVLFTGVLETTKTLEDYDNDIKSKRLIVGKIKEGDELSYFAITPSFIAEYTNNLPNSLVYVGACDSTYNSTLAKAFKDQGAGAVVGYSRVVDSKFADPFGRAMFNAMIADRTVTQIPGINTVRDPYGTKALFETAPNSALDLSINIGLRNGSFEIGNFSAWTKEGNASIINGLGSLTTPQGQNMALISTGSSLNGSDNGSVSQEFFVPANAKDLILTYDVVSEEPMEYVGSPFDDKFEVLLKPVGTSGNSQSITVASETINTSTWIPISGINFPGGDATTFHTGFKTVAFNLASFQGQKVNLLFRTYDQGDGAYDTAALIDNIRITTV